MLSNIPQDILGKIGEHLSEEERDRLACIEKTCIYVGDSKIFKRDIPPRVWRNVSRFVERRIPLIQPEMEDIVINMLSGDEADGDNAMQAEVYDVYLKQNVARPSSIAEWYLEGVQTGNISRWVQKKWSELDVNDLKKDLIRPNSPIGMTWVVNLLFRHVKKPSVARMTKSLLETLAIAWEKDESPVGHRDLIESLASTQTLSVGMAVLNEKNRVDALSYILKFCDAKYINKMPLAHATRAMSVRMRERLLIHISAFIVDSPSELEKFIIHAKAPITLSENMRAPFVRKLLKDKKLRSPVDVRKVPASVLKGLTQSTYVASMSHVREQLERAIQVGDGDTFSTLFPFAPPGNGQELRQKITEREISMKDPDREEFNRMREVITRHGS
jgi:hypothetical protein